MYKKDIIIKPKSKKQEEYIITKTYKNYFSLYEQFSEVTMIHY